MVVDDSRFPVVVLGGSGYVSGELLRLLGHHRHLRVAGVVSASRVGARVAEVFPHLAGTTTGAMSFLVLDELDGVLEEAASAGVFTATPHGETASLVDRLLEIATASGRQLRVVDSSADFRFPDPADYERVYGRPHGAPKRCPSFVCAVPEHHEGAPPEHASHPGCFTTAVVLAAYPLLASGLCEGEVFACAVTGSSGAGRMPAATTHHPERRSTMFTYSPLAHRHEPEVARLLAPANGGAPPRVELVPVSGPLVRGIHATARLSLKEPAPLEEVMAVLTDFYRDSAFVSVTPGQPRLSDVVGSNRCRLGVATRDHTVVVTSVIDNLVKGAAGGAVQWMNRIAGLGDADGLDLPGLGWV